MKGHGEELLSLRQAAQQSGLSTSRLRRLAAKGTLQARKAGAYWVVTSAALKAFMALERPRGLKASARSRAKAARQRGKGGIPR